MAYKHKELNAMFKEIINYSLIGAGLVLLISLPAVAVERMDGESYQAACRAHQAEGVEGKASNSQSSDKSPDICAAFLSGYLAAVESFYMNSGEEKNYYDRAVETRAKGLLSKDRMLKGKRYCIPEDEPIDSIIGRINASRLSEDEARYADNVIKAVLDSHYRCP